ncbi:hypothetical protein JXB02_02905 [Candidatus Woesearchaeota archaeon]|nr:hypothetical protein [Candidatus Woesearchaeota archaeon]
MENLPADHEETVRRAGEVFRGRFPPTTRFERALFYGWYCSIGDCGFCYMSLPHNRTRPGARRSVHSLVAETVLCRELGWNLGFLSGGHDAHTLIDFRRLVRAVSEAYGEKVWINAGPLMAGDLRPLLPYLKGIVASIETANPGIHERVCPSKPMGPFEESLKAATGFGLARAMTIILGLGETTDDYPLLKEFITKHGISKIHFYGLNPHPGTVFEDAKPPSAAYHSWWIAKTRIDFPGIDIQAGIWEDRAGNVAELLRAGANSISKFPAIRRFGGVAAREIERQAAAAGRRFEGTLTALPEVDWQARVDALALPEEDRALVSAKLRAYLQRMRSGSPRPDTARA